MNIRCFLAGFILVVVAITAGSAVAGGGQQEQLITALQQEAQLRVSPSEDFMSYTADTLDIAHGKLAPALAGLESRLNFPPREGCTAFVTAAAGGGQQEQLITAPQREAHINLSDQVLGV